MAFVGDVLNNPLAKYVTFTFIKLIIIIIILYL